MQRVHVYKVVLQMCVLLDKHRHGKMKSEFNREYVGSNVKPIVYVRCVIRSPKDAMPQNLNHSEKTLPICLYSYICIHLIIYLHYKCAHHFIHHISTLVNNVFVYLVFSVG